MFHEKNISKFIKLIPILFILITALALTVIRLNELNSNFDTNYKKLKEELLVQQEESLKEKMIALHDYIEYKQNSSEALLEERLTRRIEIAYNIATNIYNRQIGIEPKKKILEEVRSVLEKIHYQNRAKYIVTTQKLFVEEKEAFLFSKPFNDLGIVISYKENEQALQKELQEDILRRLSRMHLKDKSSYVYAIDENNRLLHHSELKQKIGTSFATLKEEKITANRIKEFIIESHTEQSSNTIRMIYEQPNEIHDAYKISSLKYIKDWDWVIVGSLYAQDLEQRIEEIIGTQKQEYNRSLSQTILVTVILVLIVSIISFFISRKVSEIFKAYQIRIETQKNALKNINATLEHKVKQKTKELEKFNQELQLKVNDEVLKNRRKDQILYHQSKMASMGEMLGNIAHQWRQPLSAISTTASGMELKLDYDIFNRDDAKRDIESIVKTTQYLSQTIDDFRNFFAEDKHFEYCDLQTIVENDLRLIGASLKNENINIVLNLESIEAKVIKNELSQGILNILTNAKDVLSERIININERFIFIDLFKEDEYAVITIKDSAGGIEKAIVEKIYEPYFTTKHQSQGTGIGLYMTREIIVKHMKGTIQTHNESFSYEDRAYKGAVFTIKIPL